MKHTTLTFGMSLPEKSNQNNLWTKYWTLRSQCLNPLINVPTNPLSTPQDSRKKHWIHTQKSSLMPHKYHHFQPQKHIKPQVRSSNYNSFPISDEKF